MRDLHANDRPFLAYTAQGLAAKLAIVIGAIGLGACQTDNVPGGASSSFGTSSFGTSSGTTDVATTTVDTGSSTSSASGTTGGSESVDEDTGVVDTGTTMSSTNFDTMPPDAGGRDEMCKVGDELDAPPACTEQAEPDSFEPEVQWAWNDVLGAMTTPLVANLTDDNNDGEVDLCDTPDVVVVVGQDPPRKVYVLDGATGMLHFSIPDTVSIVTPALGDIDDDGLVEIVTATPAGNLIAFENDGTKKWEKPVSWPVTSYQLAGGSAIALGDVDNDGDVEILGAGFLADHEGNQLWELPMNDGTWSLTEYERLWQAPTLADLDGDQDLEIVMGQSAYHHDGTVFYQAQVRAGFPQVADLDGDLMPEVLLTNADGLTLLEHDGTVVYQDLTPTGDPTYYPLMWMRPATIHDFDGDMGQTPEYAMSSRTHYTAYNADATILWSVDVLDQTGLAAGTAFDFLGDGTAEAMYADETTLFIYDGQSGAPVLTAPRSSGTLIEYPTVADIDNDGSAEILVMSQKQNNGPQTSPSLQAIRDIDDRWIQARRIWNQHTYHVTNVREDGTIPQFEPPNWETLNTFRTNAQIEGGSVCRPVD